MIERISQSKCSSSTSGLCIIITCYHKEYPYSRNNRTTCLQSCSKEGFKAVNILIAKISSEIWISASITTMWRPRQTWNINRYLDSLRSLRLWLCSHGYDIVPSQKSGTERGWVPMGTEKINRSVPKQVQKLGGREKWTRKTGPV